MQSENWSSFSKLDQFRLGKFNWEFSMGLDGWAQEVLHKKYMTS